jgi:hypothetical protein
MIGILSQQSVGMNVTKALITALNDFNVKRVIKILTLAMLAILAMSVNGNGLSIHT